MDFKSSTHALAEKLDELIFTAQHAGNFADAAKLLSDRILVAKQSLSAADAEFKTLLIDSTRPLNEKLQLIVIMNLTISKNKEIAENDNKSTIVE
ncbi:MAG: hypothetical protein AB8V23_04675 [Candidatus Midichloria sp.]|uniref:Uncharacterized protein n=1 Tax=Hyalomma marginatum TaxID=34627 RepID=A0A8S4C2F9_9ACAR|nr:hypothetical protein MHYMCMPSP_00951 [Hyalomma marginatum]CAG7597051.1 hypothetical protein MHYMCMPASI_00907 [Hyalomma marginatum]